jgi:hypothetical protein
MVRARVPAHKTDTGDSHAAGRHLHYLLPVRCALFLWVAMAVAGGALLLLLVVKAPLQVIAACAVILVLFGGFIVVVRR